MQSYGDSALKGIKDFGYKTRNNFDKFNKEATAKFKGFCKFYYVFLFASKQMNYPLALETFIYNI